MMGGDINDLDLGVGKKRGIAGVMPYRAEMGGELLCPGRVCAGDRGQAAGGGVPQGARHDPGDLAGSQDAPSAFHFQAPPTSARTPDTRRSPARQAALVSAAAVIGSLICPSP